jgi:hypothetical protein
MSVSGCESGGVFCRDCFWLAEKPNTTNYWYCEAPQNKVEQINWYGIVTKREKPQELNAHNNCSYWANKGNKRI